MDDRDISSHISGLKYRQVDVFARGPLTGNGLAVFFEAEGLSRDIMQQLTREMRQFESIFLSREPAGNTFRAFIFTMEEELDFAGHPILGAAAAVHERYGEGENGDWTFILNAREVRVSSSRTGNGYQATMNQGLPSFGAPLTGEQVRPFLAALGLSAECRAEGFPLQVVSTGLPYLIVPVRQGLEHARVVLPGFESLLSAIGAKFTYVLDVGAREGRTWDNDGRVEDIATGSAAGPAAAYLCRHGAAGQGKTMILHQGRFTGRPSEIEVLVEGTAEKIEIVSVSGRVHMIASGVFD